MGGRRGRGGPEAGDGFARACRLLKVSRTAYYQRRDGVLSPRAAADAVLSAKITSICTESKGTYGSPRVHQALRRQGAGCGKRRVARLMRAAGLEGRRKKRWRTTTIADPAAERARDLIQRDFAPRPGTDQRYAGDITYIMTWEGWAYLATVIDLSSRRVVGWALADHMRTELVEDALAMTRLGFHRLLAEPAGAGSPPAALRPRSLSYSTASISPRASRSPRTPRVSAPLRRSWAR